MQEMRVVYLCCNVGILFSVAIAVVGIDVVTPHHSVHGLQHHPAVVVRDHIGISEMKRIK